MGESLKDRPFGLLTGMRQTAMYLPIQFAPTILVLKTWVGL